MYDGGRVRARYARGDLDAARRDLERWAAAVPDQAEAHNELAWHAVVVGRADDAALAAAQRAVTLSRRQDASVLHTLAAVHAIRGEVGAAYQALVESMAVDDAQRLFSQKKTTGSVQIAARFTPS